MRLSVTRETLYGQNDETAKQEKGKERRLFHICFTEKSLQEQENKENVLEII